MTIENDIPRRGWRNAAVVRGNSRHYGAANAALFGVTFVMNTEILQGAHYGWLIVSVPLMCIAGLSAWSQLKLCGTVLTIELTPETWMEIRERVQKGEIKPTQLQNHAEIIADYLINRQELN